MANRPKVILHRDNPEKEPLIGHIKVTREDWLNAAREILINAGVAEVKILSLSQKLGVSRSSFYWYFTGRTDLLAQLLDDWENRNTSSIVRHCGVEAATITESLCNFFRCFVDPELFDPGLDFAVREWARRDQKIRKRIDQADQQRLKAVTHMFERFEYSPGEADIRARILYFMQIGYHALELRESLEERMGRVEGFLEGFTGRKPKEGDVAGLVAFMR